MRDYADFEILVQPRQGDTYPVTVLRSAAGEARGELRLSAADVQRLQQDARVFRDAVTRAARDVAPESTPAAAQAGGAARARDLGGALFAALFAGEIRSRLAASRALAGEAGLRIRLRIEPPELAALPWEVLWDPERREHIALSRRTPVVRYVPVGQPPQRRRRGRALRMLAADASPAALPALDVRRERERLQAALRGPRALRLLDVAWYPDATAEGLRERLTRPVDIVHFAGHGGIDPQTGAGYLALSGGDGWARLEAQELGRLLGDNDGLRLLVLNACHGAAGEHDVVSSLAVASLHAGVPAVLAMQGAITDEAAIELSRIVYGALAAGRPVDEALAEARQALAMADDRTAAWATPVLYLRAPDGHLFKRPRPLGRYALAALGAVVAVLVAWMFRPVDVVVRVVDAHGEPVRDAQVAWERRPKPALTAVTNERGEIVLPDVPGHTRRFGQTARIRVDAKGWEPVEVEPRVAELTTIALCWRAEGDCYVDPDQPLELAVTTDLPEVAWELRWKGSVHKKSGSWGMPLRLDPGDRRLRLVLSATLPADKRANVRWQVLQSGAPLCGDDRVTARGSFHFTSALQPRRCDAAGKEGVLSAPAPRGRAGVPGPRP